MTASRDTNDDSSVQRIDRRHLLKAAPAVALGGAVAVAAGAAPADASPGNPVLQGRINDAGAATTTLISTGSPALSVRGTVEAQTVTTGAVTLETYFGGVPLTVEPMPNHRGPAAVITGAQDVGGMALTGENALVVSAVGPGAAITATAIDGGSSAQPTPVAGTAVVARADSGVAVQSVSNSGTAVDATTVSGHAIRVHATSFSSPSDAVTISYAGTSRALWVQSYNPANTNGTVTGVNEGHGIGVWGEQRNNTGPGIGVVGIGGSQGRGSQFTGGAAQTRLVPSSAATHPTSGKAGDLFVDAAVRLWFCTQSSSGTTAATWKRVTLT
jgi:hypothetical protein